jgi:hypothetical protein
VGNAVKHRVNAARQAVSDGRSAFDFGDVHRKRLRDVKRVARVFESTVAV